MKEKTITRNSNIELLRILAMIGVIILHYNNADIGGGFRYVEPGTPAAYMLNALESLSICAVDLFIMISGYFMCNSYSRSLMKPLQLLVQVVVFKVVGTAISFGWEIMSGAGAYSMKEIAYHLLEAAVPNNYFVILYIALYLISAYINLAINALDAKEMRKMLIILIALFSIWTTMVDILNGFTNMEWNGLSTVGIYGDQMGYTIINFVLMYCLGAYMRNASQKRYSMKKLALLNMIVVVVITLWSFTFAAGSAWTYCNPFVILSAVLLLQMFKQMPERNNAVINAVAKSCFTVYLGHGFILPHIGVQRVCDSPAIMLLHIVIFCPVIFGLCWIIHFIYERCTNYFLQKLATCKILSENIICIKKRGGGGVIEVGYYNVKLKGYDGIFIEPRFG